MLLKILLKFAKQIWISDSRMEYFLIKKIIIFYYKNIEFYYIL